MLLVKPGEQHRAADPPSQNKHQLIWTA